MTKLIQDIIKSLVYGWRNPAAALLALAVLLSGFTSCDQVRDCRNQEAHGFTAAGVKVCWLERGAACPDPGAVVNYHKCPEVKP